MENLEIIGLKEELEKSREVVKKLESESYVLKKAIWDMLNYANMYVLLLDCDMTIRLVNWSLATDLGFENEQEVIGKNWSEFIPENCKKIVKTAHRCLAFEDNKKRYRELTNDIQTLSGKKITVKWFNIHINSSYQMTFSIGLKSNILKSSDATIVSEDSIRSYYRDIIEKDRTMIQSLKDVVIGGIPLAEEK